MTLTSVAAVQNGSSTVTRVSGDIWDNLLPGAVLLVSGDNVNYVVATVAPFAIGTTATTLFLTTVYGGTDNPNAPVTISIDFTPHRNLPLINTGDIEAASLYDRSMTILDTATLETLPSHGATHRPLFGSDPIPYADQTDGGIFPPVSGNDSDIIGGDMACRDITLVRLRAYNALGNPAFEVDLENAGTATTLTGTNQRLVDRWFGSKAGTLAATGQRISAGLTVAGGVLNPGGSRIISTSFLRIQMVTSEPSLAAGDSLFIKQFVEGPRLKELIGGNGHSIAVLVRTTASNLNFGLSLRDPANGHSIVYIGNIPTPNVWTIVKFPNIPTWPSAGNFTLAAESIGYSLGICLASGTAAVTPSNASWQNGNFFAAIGQSNFAAQAAGAQFDIAFAQHQFGVSCSSLFDAQLLMELEDAGRYLQKSYPSASIPGAIIDSSENFYVPASAQPVTPIRFNKGMAGVPTVVGYSPATGAINNIRSVTGSADVATTGVSAVSQTGFSGFTIASPPASVVNYNFHWTADTGM